MIDTINNNLTVTVHHVADRYWTGTITLNYHVLYQGMAATIEGMFKIMGVALKELDDNTPEFTNV